MIRHMFIIAALVLMVGCLAPDFGGDSEHINLSYKEYKSRVGVDSFDPDGASQICLRTLSSRDGYDSWWRMQIGRVAFAHLLDEMSSNLERPEYASYNSRSVGPIRKTSTGVPSFPDNWPQPDDEPPKWWNPPRSGQGLQCIRWELQVGDKSSDGRAKGWYWLYDSRSESLWIWEWNHQWFDLGWNKFSNWSDTAPGCFLGCHGTNALAFPKPNPRACSITNISSTTISVETHRLIVLDG
jgi:hypothetical protein